MSKARRGEEIEKKPSLKGGLELTHPLTARAPSAESRLSKGSEFRLGGRGVEGSMRETIRSLSPGVREAPITPGARVSPASSAAKGKLENYAVGKQIGQGAYAVVRFATHKTTNLKVAIKSYEKTKLLDSHRKLSVKREIAILEKLNHQYTIRLLETIESPKHLNLVLEYVGGVSLHSYIKQRVNRRLEPAEAWRLFKQVLAATEYCHSVNVAHRDLKLENILLDESNNVKLIDFGFSTCMPADKRTCTFCGTPSYMAPEIISRREYAGPPVDVWALGVLLYAMLCGCFPFKGSCDSDLYRKIQRGVFSVPEHVEEGPKRLIKKMIQLDPTKRPTAADLLAEDWVETGASQAPQPDPESQDSSVSTARQGRTSSTAALFIRPLTAIRKPALPTSSSKALLRRNTSHAR